jgi:hypothetical protein
MPRKRPAPSAPSAASASSESAAGGKREPATQDRFGPLAVERHVKDDGRSLILYTHVRREQA